MPRRVLIELVSLRRLLLRCVPSRARYFTGHLRRNDTGHRLLAWSAHNCVRSARDPTHDVHCSWGHDADEADSDPQLCDHRGLGWSARRHLCAAAQLRPEFMALWRRVSAGGSLQLRCERDDLRAAEPVVPQKPPVHTQRHCGRVGESRRHGRGVRVGGGCEHIWFRGDDGDCSGHRAHFDRRHTIVNTRRPVARESEDGGGETCRHQRG
mmetsp:Transcript_17907/g.46942  ORF Transcript_17907/g.46942 Transcript_17907/m.46942 type:complete len:210 (+) Transcript_17907:1773-2402(+)